jgi:hypothetical protein
MKKVILVFTICNLFFSTFIVYCYNIYEPETPKDREIRIKSDEINRNLRVKNNERFEDAERLEKGFKKANEYFKRQEIPNLTPKNIWKRFREEPLPWQNSRNKESVKQSTQKQTFVKQNQWKPPNVNIKAQILWMQQNMGMRIPEMHHNPLGHQNQFPGMRQNQMPRMPEGHHAHRHVMQHQGNVIHLGIQMQGGLMAPIGV